VLLALLDRIEYLSLSEVGYETEMFNALAHALDYYYRRKRKLEITNDRI